MDVTNELDTPRLPRPLHGPVVRALGDPEHEVDDLGDGRPRIGGRRRRPDGPGGGRRTGRSVRTQCPGQWPTPRPDGRGAPCGPPDKGSGGLVAALLQPRRLRIRTQCPGSPADAAPRGARRTCRDPEGCTGFQKCSARNARLCSRPRDLTVAAHPQGPRGVCRISRRGLSYPRRLRPSNGPAPQPTTRPGGSQRTPWSGRTAEIPSAGYPTRGGFGRRMARPQPTP